MRVGFLLWDWALLRQVNEAWRLRFLIVFLCDLITQLVIIIWYYFQFDRIVGLIFFNDILDWINLIFVFFLTAIILLALSFSNINLSFYIKLIIYLRNKKFRKV